MTPSPDPLDAAMHSVWLHGNWQWLTRCMTTEQREAAASAVERHHAALQQVDPDPHIGPPSSLRWWTE